MNKLIIYHLILPIITTLFRPNCNKYDTEKKQIPKLITLTELHMYVMTLKKFKLTNHKPGGKIQLAGVSTLANWNLLAISQIILHQVQNVHIIFSTLT